ncbi:MAG: hypothetical protein JWL64_1622, partial [Frankiales bacterium]|nr:hypothetical protein [Frankiales bacterium]
GIAEPDGETDLQTDLEAVHVAHRYALDDAARLPARVRAPGRLRGWRGEGAAAVAAAMLRP